MPLKTGETFVAIKSPGSASQLNKSYDKFLAKCEFLHRAVHQLALADEAYAQAWVAAQDQLQLCNWAWQLLPQKSEEWPQEPQKYEYGKTERHNQNPPATKNAQHMAQPRGNGERSRRVTLRGKCLSLIHI